jgi:hypothetical protein
LRVSFGNSFHPFTASCTAAYGETVLILRLAIHSEIGIEAGSGDIGLPYAGLEISKVETYERKRPEHAVVNNHAGNPQPSFTLLKDACDILWIRQIARDHEISWF